MAKKKKKEITETPKKVRRIHFKKYRKAIYKSTPSERKELYKLQQSSEKATKKAKARRALGLDKRDYGKTAEKFKKKLFAREGRKAITRRARAAKGILTAMGVTGGAQRYSGAGRPRGTYKYGMPIHEYKKKLSMKKALYQEYQDKQQLNLQRRGLSAEQIQQLQMARTTQELQQPQQYPQQQYPQRIQQRAEEIRMIRQGSSRPQVERQETISRERGYPQHSFESQDDELRFQDWRANNTVSPNTQRLLNDIRRIQNKGKSDNIAQKRRNWERRLVGASTNLMHAHQNMINVDMNFTGVDMNENILGAPSVFRENNSENILRQNRPSILNTRDSGNDLHF